MKGVYQWSCHVAKLGAAGTGGKPVQTSFGKKPANRSVKCCLCELQLSSAVSFWPDVMKYHPNPFCNLAQILNQSSSRLCWKIQGKTHRPTRWMLSAAKIAKTLWQPRMWMRCANWAPLWAVWATRPRWDFGSKPDLSANPWP